MTLRTRRPRTAFTLVELLVVIAIGALLMALLTAGVMRVRDAGDRTANFDRMAQIGSAIGTAKQKVNMPYVWAGPFTLKSKYLGNEPELDILLQMFPNMMTQTNPVPGLAANDPNQNNGYTGADVVLDANQALVLLLTGGAPTGQTGFSTNPRRPFLSGGERKGPFLDNNPKWFSIQPTAPVGQSLNTMAPGHPWVVDPYGVPYAVLASVKGKNNNYFPVSNPSIAGPQSFYGVLPYKTAAGYINPNGFQFVSAGKDMTFGPGDVNIPVATSPGGADDQANFSRTTLAGGIE